MPEPGAPVTADATVPAEVLVVEHLGSDTLLHLALPGGATVDAEGSGELEIDPGTKIEIGLSGERCHLFNGHGQAIGR